jgi:hypothetical protein
VGLPAESTFSLKVSILGSMWAWSLTGKKIFLLLS